MTNKITWSQNADAAILMLRAAGTPWHTVANELRVGRNSVIERARRLGLPPMKCIARPTTQLQSRNDRGPLPAGHPVTWSAITAGTTLDNTPYPLPVFL